MTPEEIEAIVDQHRYPTLHAGETGINVITLQIWLRMLGFYQGAITGLLDAATAQAVAAFRAQQLAAGIALEAPAGAVLGRDTWEAMDNLLQQRIPPDPATLERLPFPRRSSYDSEAKYRKALYEGLRAFGFPVKPAAEPLRLPVVINERGIAILHGFPPGSYTLELGDAVNPAQGSADLHLDNADGTHFSGQIRLIRDGAAQSATVVDGHALVNGLEAGDYQVVVEKVDTANQIIDNTGSLEIRLIDANNQPVSGMATLVGETGDIASLRQAVRLFQALSRKITSGLEPGDRTRLGNILTGEFAETAHHHHEQVWDEFEQTWGRFHGAPWMGVVFHPVEEGDPGREQDELNWGARETIARLYEWGNAYLQDSKDAADLEDRLRRPVAVRYIARMLGGSVDKRSDFSEIGTQASIHLPHKPDSAVRSIAIGQTYGDIGYDSAEYSSPHLESQVIAFVSLDNRFRTQCPDDAMVDRILPPELQPFESRLTADRCARNRSVNLSTGIRDQWRVATSSGEKRLIYFSLKSALPLTEDQLNWLWYADTEFYKTAKIKQILSASLLTERISNQRFKYLFALGIIKEIQKALWWCRMLLRADRRVEVKELSDRFIARGYEGLFKEYAKALDQGALDKGIAKLAFDDNDWENPWQLEALVEFYINFNDPWDSGNPEVGKNNPRLPGNVGFKDVSDKISKDLHFILVDPMGYRLSGSLASKKVTNDPEKVIVELAGATTGGTFPEQEFGKVNPRFDTIHFPEAKGRRTYRIREIDVKGHCVTLDATTAEINGPWQIPAGVGGRVPIRYPVNAKKLLFGYDHYDGTLFVVKDGLVRGRYSFTSYTSRKNEGLGQRVSLRGNRKYDFFSWRAGNKTINCAFAVKTPDLDDARAYFDQTITTSDQSGIYIHFGYFPYRTGSWGCQVSPAFYELRELMFHLYPDTTVEELSKEWKKSNTPKDKEELNKHWIDVWRKTLNLLKSNNDEKKGRTLSTEKDAKVWNNAIQGIFWLIRPDEPPLG